MSEEKKRTLYAAYSEAGYKIKVYDYPVMQTAGKKRYLREFDIEELLFRKPIAVNNEKTAAYYRGKVILITGGGGSIGKGVGFERSGCRTSAVRLSFRSGVRN